MNACHADNSTFVRKASRVFTFCLERKRIPEPWDEKTSRTRARWAAFLPKNTCRRGRKRSGHIPKEKKRRPQFSTLVSFYEQFQRWRLQDLLAFYDEVSTKKKKKGLALINRLERRNEIPRALKELNECVAQGVLPPPPCWQKCVC
jgi:hypothetical protein